MKRLAQLLIIIGALLYFVGMYQVWLRVNPNRLAFSDYPTVEKVAAKSDTVSTPIRLLINNKQIDVPVIPAEVSNNVWQTTENGASYLSSSPVPGQKGNSVIYAHNWSGLFANLPQVKPGDTVEILYADNTRKVFEVKYTSYVSPNEATILAPSKDQRITLYTCAGWFDNKRFVAVAILKDA